MWVTNAMDNTVSALRARNGNQQRSFFGGRTPLGIACDGSNVWIADYSYGATVIARRIRNGALIAKLTLGGAALDVLHDGLSIWVANQENNSVTKISRSDP
jgi:DNA-binding beta-propeller fold protein YncE